MELHGGFKFYIVELERHYCTCGYQDEDGKARKLEEESNALFKAIQKHDSKKETN